MLQVATFLLPNQQDMANEFLKIHKPVGNIDFNKDTIVVFYEDDPAADLVELVGWVELRETHHLPRGGFHFV
jgi:hypothetical protein